MTYAESAQRGDVLRTLQFAIFAGALWAIGSSWATAIRGISTELVPADVSVVWAELFAATVTTLLGVGITLGVAYGCGLKATRSERREGTRRHPLPSVGRRGRTGAGWRDASAARAHTGATSASAGARAAVP